MPLRSAASASSYRPSAVRLVARPTWDAARNGSSAIACCLSATASSSLPSTAIRVARLLVTAAFCGASSRARRYSASASANLKSLFIRTTPCAKCESARFGYRSSDRFAGTGFCDRLLSFLRRNTDVVVHQTPRRERQLRVGERITRVAPDRLLVVAERFARILASAAIRIEISLQERVVGLDILIRWRGRGGQLRGLRVVPQQRDLELLRHRAGNLRLHREDVLQFPVVGFRPDIGTVCGFDQRHRDPHPIG